MSTFKEKLEERLIAITNGGHFDEGDRAMYEAGAREALLGFVEEIEAITARDEEPASPTTFERWVFYNQGACNAMSDELRSRAQEIAQ